MAIPTQEPQKESKDTFAEAVFQLSRRSCTQHLAQDQAQIEGSHMNQLPLQNVLVSAQVSASHATRLIGYFEGIDAERAIAWRLADSLSVLVGRALLALAVQSRQLFARRRRFQKFIQSLVKRMPRS